MVPEASSSLYIIGSSKIVLDFLLNLPITIFRVIHSYKFEVQIKNFVFLIIYSKLTDAISIYLASRVGLPEINFNNVCLVVEGCVIFRKELDL